MTNSITTAPTALPVALAAVKDYLRITTSDEDTTLTALIHTATAHVESAAGVQLVDATRAHKMDNWPGSKVAALPYPPLLSVSSISYLDDDGESQTLSTDEYTVDATSYPGRFYLSYNGQWPTLYGVRHAVTVNYLCGMACPFTANDSTEVLTWSGRAPADDDVVRVVNSGGALPAGLSADTDYYVIDSSDQTCKLSAESGGSAVDVTDAGSGTNFIVDQHAGKFLLGQMAVRLLTAHLYEFREPVTSGGALAEVPMSVRSLIDAIKVVESP